jgi:superfamily II DNA or RNA helicase
MTNSNTWRCEDVLDRPLKPAASKGLFDLHLSALEWSLVEPIIINDQADIKASNWKERGLTPFTHQVQNLVTFCRRLPVALIADDVGLGKTISAGLILSELITRRRVSRVLIICPKILTTQWVSELDEKFGLVSKEVSGSDFESEINRSTPIVVTTYHSASSRLENIEEGTFDLCILDEAHKLRNLYGSQKPPKMALNVKEALERRPFKFVLMLTATPIQNKIWDLYSLVDLLKTAEGKPNPLGTPEVFSEVFLEPRSGGRKLNPDKAQIFQKIVRPSLTRTRRSDVKLNFPLRKIQLMRVTLAGAELEMIRVVGRLIENLSALLQVSVAQAMMSSPRALVAQAENMFGSGKISEKVVSELKDLAQRVPEPAKLKQLFTVIEFLKKNKPNDWRMVVFTVRRETQEMIGEALRKAGIQVGFIHGANHEANNKAIAKYKQKPPNINVLVSTDAGSEGINLQAGNVMINYDLPWNPMVVEQRIGRIQRLGSDFQNVVIWNLVGAGTVEDHIVGRLTEKLQGISQAIGDIEGILEAADIDADEGDSSYESRIRKMVVDSLRGKDVTKSQKMLEENIQEARDLFEARRVDLDEQLGGDPNQGLAVERPPKIERKEPKIPAKTFVLEAKKAQGFNLSPIGDNLFEARMPGAVPEKICFHDDLLVGNQKAIFTDQHVKSFLPGKPQFERLVQHWVDHNAHHVIDKSATSQEQAIEIAEAWCASCNGLEFVRAEFILNKPVFAGTVHIRVKAATGVDSFEKLLRGRIQIPPTHGKLKVSQNEAILSGDLKVSQVMSHQFQLPIKRAVEGDQEVQKFCGFYLKRLGESLRQAGNDPVRKAKVESDFRPFVQADVMGLDGIRYEEGEIKVGFQVEGHRYSTTLLAIPASGTVLKSPTLGRCSVTGINAPLECLGKCNSTGKIAFKHHLSISGNGEMVLADQLVTCSISGAQIIKSDAIKTQDGKYIKKELMRPCEFTGELLEPDEIGVSEYSQKIGNKKKLMNSDLSGKKGFPEEFVVCIKTNRKLLPEEAIQGKPSGNWYGKDQLVQSAASDRLGTPDEMVSCEISGQSVLPDELAVCAISQKRVVPELLVESPVSGKRFLPEFGIKTSNGNTAVPGDVAECEISKEILLRSECGNCSLTGKTVALSKLSRSSASGNLYITEYLNQTDDGQLALPEEISNCIWDGRTTLRKQLVECRLTGNLVTQRYLNPDQELSELRQLLDGVITGTSVSAEMANGFSLIPGLKAAKQANTREIASPSGYAHAVVLEEKSGWFSVKVKVYGGIFRSVDNGEVLLGKLAEGERRNGRFETAP